MTPATFSFSRTFNAPRVVVFQAWSKAEELAQWWGPKGMELEIGTLAFQPGGLFHYRMRSPEGFEMWGRFVYRDIAAPEQLTFVTSFADAAGNAVRAPFSALYPLQVLNRVRFAEEAGRTVLTLEGTPLEASAEEHAFFAGMKESMQQGFSSTLDQLARHVEKK